ncbi:MAG: efflux transporter outer membrane subunit [Desulfovibrio sp.]|nr:efflux transporter outer membrane subunit [Desulfovibrio sp.]
MRTLSPAFLTLVLAGTLFSCSIYKDYERPSDVLPEGLYGAAADSVALSDSAGLAAVRWQDFFTDPLLQGLISRGLENNADLLAAATRVVEAEAGLEAARGAFLPSLSVRPSWQLENAARYGGTVIGYSVAPAASWEMDLRGSLLNSRRLAEASLEQARLYERSVRTALVASIANAYYTLQMLDAQLEISRTTSDNWKKNVLIMKAMKDAGMANEASVSQAEANSCSIEASLFDLENKVLLAENSLALVLGVTPGHFDRDSLSREALPREFEVGVPSLLLSRRPDVMAAEQELRRAYYNTNIARASLYPSLTLSGDFGWEKALTSPAGWAAGLAASALAPLFEGNRRRAGLQAAEARQETALVAFRQKVLAAGSEVNGALAQCHMAQSKTDIRIRQIEALEKAVESTQQLMRHSQSTYLEVLTAQQSLLSARLQQVSDHYEAVQGLIALYRALGGGTE